MAATPTYQLSDGVNTVKLEWTQAPEQFKRRTHSVPVQVRKKLDAGPTTPGRVQLLKGAPTKDGQTLTTNHRRITPTDDARLLAWSEAKTELTFNDGTETSTVVVLNYVANPRTTAHHWDKSVVVEELTLLFFEDES